MADNNPPYFPLSTQAAKIKDALQLEDERLWNALRVSSSTTSPSCRSVQFTPALVLRFRY